ncbi:hypothetical protein TorRG33x02_311220, partial [Trema orientale]
PKTHIRLLRISSIFNTKLIKVIPYLTNPRGAFALKAR